MDLESHHKPLGIATKQPEASTRHACHRIYKPAICSGLEFLGQFRPEVHAALAASAFCFSLT